MGDVLEHAALRDAGGVLGADQLDRDVGLDLLVELDLVQVEVQEVVADGVALLLLEHHRDRRRALDLDVEEGAAVDEHVAHRTRRRLERTGLVAAAVDDAGHQPVAAQAAALARAELGSRLSLQGDAVGGHAAAEDREPRACALRKRSGCRRQTRPGRCSARPWAAASRVPSRIPARASPGS